MRKLLLLLCLAFVVVGFCYPCVICPYTDYVVTTKVGDKEYQTKYNFKFNGKVRVSYSESNSSEEYYYKFAFTSKEVVISDNKNFEGGWSFKIDSIYELSNGLLGTAKSKIAMYSSIGIGVAALLLLVTYPAPKRK